MNSLQLFGIKKNRPPKAWQSHAMGSGGHQTDSKPASVLANEASIEVENRQNCLTHDGIEGHYRIGFRRPSQVEQSRLSSCLKKQLAQPKQNASPAG